MNNQERQETISIIEKADLVKKEIDYTDPQTVFDLAKRIFKEPTGVLYSALGIVAGSTCGVILGTIGGVTIVATGGAGALLGGIIAAIWWRGPKMIKLEKYTSETEHSIEYLENKLENAKKRGNIKLVQTIENEIGKKIIQYSEQSSQMNSNRSIESKNERKLKPNLGEYVDFKEEKEE